MSRRGLFILPVAMYLLASCVINEVQDNQKITTLAEGIITASTDKPQNTPPSLASTRKPLTPAAALTPSPLPRNDPREISTPTYISSEGHFSINVPPHFSLYVDQVPSVDGVLTTVPNTVALQSRAAPPVLITIRYFEIDRDTSLADFLAEQDLCAAEVSGRV